MSAKTDFIRAIVEEGITAARKYFGTGIEKEIPAKRVAAAKQKFKDNKAKATQKKAADKKKADTKRSKSKATQKDVRFKKKYEVQEGMGVDAVTGRSNRAAASVDAGEAGKVTRGRKSMNNFAADQAQASPGMRARSKRDDKAYKEIMAAREAGDTKKEKALRKKQSDKLTKRQKSDEKSTRRSQLKGAQTRSGKKKAARTDYVNPETGEVFGNPTPNQLKQAATNFRARNMSAAARRVEAFMEKERIKQGRTKVGESGVGARKGGNRGMSGAKPNTTRKSDGATGRGGPLMNKGGKVTKRIYRKKK